MSTSDIIREHRDGILSGSFKWVKGAPQEGEACLMYRRQPSQDELYLGMDAHLFIEKAIHEYTDLPDGTGILAWMWNDSPRRVLSQVLDVLNIAERMAKEHEANALPV